MSKSQECHTIAEDEKCECRQDPKRKVTFKTEI